MCKLQLSRSVHAPLGHDAFAGVDADSSGAAIAPRENSGNVAARHAYNVPVRSQAPCTAGE